MSAAARLCRSPQSSSPLAGPHCIPGGPQRLRESSSHGVEALVCSPARSALRVGQSSSDDALSYFIERLDANCGRQTAASVVPRAKHNKAFDKTAFVGLVVFGTGGGRCQSQGCSLCRP
jgi:hypothetical protein